MENWMALFPELMESLNQNKEFDDYLNSILSAEKAYEIDNDIDALINFWEKLWKTESVHDLSYKHAFRLTNLYVQKEDYSNALVALHYLDDTPYFSNYNNIYNRLYVHITDHLKGG